MTDLTPLPELTNLEYLSIHSVPVESVEPIANLRNRNLIMRTSILGQKPNFLSGLTRLKRLNLRNTGITDTQYWLI